MSHVHLADQDPAELQARQVHRLYSAHQSCRRATSTLKVTAPLLWEFQESLKQAQKQADQERQRLETERLDADARTDLLRTLSAIVGAYVSIFCCDNAADHSAFQEADKQVKAERERRMAEDKLIETQEELLRKRGTHDAIKVTFMSSQMSTWCIENRADVANQ